MKVSIREGVSLKRIKRVLKAIKDALAEADLADWILHAPQSELLALVMLAFAKLEGWVVVGLITAGFAWLMLQDSEEVLPMKDTETETKPGRPVTGEPPTAVTIPAWNVPSNFVEIAKQGIGVRIIIELKPGP
jgi:hypothetical protein